MAEAVKDRVKLGPNPYSQQFTCSRCRKVFCGGGTFLRIEHAGNVVEVLAGAAGSLTADYPPKAVRKALDVLLDRVEEDGDPEVRIAALDSWRRSASSFPLARSMDEDIASRFDSDPGRAPLDTLVGLAQSDPEKAVREKAVAAAAAIREALEVAAFFEVFPREMGPDGLLVYSHPTRTNHEKTGRPRMQLARDCEHRPWPMKEGHPRKWPMAKQAV